MVWGNECPVCWGHTTAPSSNGSMVFQNIFCNKVIAARLGCMTSVIIWRETVKYDELTINERQK